MSDILDYEGWGARPSKAARLRIADRDARFRRAQRLRDRWAEEEHAAEAERIAAQIEAWEADRDAA